MPPSSAQVTSPSDRSAPQKLVQSIRQAQNIWLTTHRQADGDGLACQAALFSALTSLGKSAKILNFENPARKYRFLFEDAAPRIFDADLNPDPPELIIVFDTNDPRLVSPLAEWATQRQVPLAMLDHHQALSVPVAGFDPELSWIDVQAASTGEVTLALIDELGIELTPKIATALYASLAFDTQLFRFVRGSPRSHLMAARLLPLVDDPARVQESLFANLTPSKLHFMAEALAALRIEHEGQLAVVILRRTLFDRTGAEASDSGDVVDLALNVESVRIALLLREEKEGFWKISLRSKRNVSVSEIAEAMGGGGHRHAAGASVKGQASEIEARLRPLLIEQLRKANLEHG
ncbi:MAG TPA: DHHA1 domain-containing protein [Pseudobdellovibrionaceae bacterium]|nr:DHHA1 domain-containing protein [Pseudobdellovibrionaceae bacterium]